MKTTRTLVIVMEMSVEFSGKYIEKLSLRKPVNRLKNNISFKLRCSRLKNPWIFDTFPKESVRNYHYSPRDNQKSAVIIYFAAEA
jgi:hypothetical protein